MYKYYGYVKLNVNYFYILFLPTIIDNVQGKQQFCN